MPGLLLCFVLRYDAYKRSQLASCEAGVPAPNQLNKITYFHCSLIGYFFGKSNTFFLISFSAIFSFIILSLSYFFSPFFNFPLPIFSCLSLDGRKFWKSGWERKSFDLMTFSFLFSSLTPTCRQHTRFMFFSLFLSFSFDFSLCFL